MRHTLDDPAVMTPSKRRREIAAILARGVLRLRQCTQTPAGSGESRTVEKDSESCRDCLDEGAISSPHGLAGRRPREREGVQAWH